MQYLFFYPFMIILPSLRYILSCFGAKTIVKPLTTMKKKLLLALAAIVVAFGAKAQEKTTLSATIYNYQGDMVYFDCMQTPLIAQEFHNNPGEEHVYSFDCENLLALTVNGKTNVILQPGDSLHLEITYNGKNVKVDYSGSERAVSNNRLVKSIENLKRSLRYKEQLLGCVALDIKPKTRIDDSRLLLEKANTMITRSKASAEAKNYVASMVDYLVYMSFIEYPVMYESVRALPISEQEIGDYWSIMDGYVTRTDAESLSCPEYASLLMRYCFYMNAKATAAKGESYSMPVVMEDMSNEIAAFYDGEQRDMLLYTLLRNFIMNGQEIERADVLYKDYIANYNSNTFYRSILDMLLQ